ncbi:ROK family protein [Nocardia sp. NBC_00881]|uniref:ROK family transcriptional regulator n=1 Tax=Nocardia sp. NBC_00881 TaxID=2975995 RepID=UPI00386349B3|nr:ROK family protein [Nocardia sp. NBC_00881]
MARPQPERARDTRWRSAAGLLALVRREPGITRAAAARRLNLTTGSATEICARLRELCLLTETPAPVSGRGRPTSVLRPHPEGPVVVAIELRQQDWRCAMATVDADPHLLESGRHDSLDPGRVLSDLRQAVARARRCFGHRVRAVSVAVAGTVSDGHLVQAATLGWGQVDLTGLSPDPDLPLLLGNDATLAGVAEARTGCASNAHTALHLLVDVGIGGALIVDGYPVTGTGGAGGEYGHLPFADPSLQCPCGARGCWDLDVDGRALARHLGDPPPADPHTYTHGVLDRAPHDAATRQAIGNVVSALGSGIAGLVNAHDPDLVTLGGLAGPLRATAPADFDAAYTDGLMHFHRSQPPPVLDARHRDDGALHGAIAVGLDHITSGSALADWAEHHQP